MPEVSVSAGFIAGWLLTYLIHSTVVIGVVWILTRVGAVRSPATRDLLWKSATVAGILTASVAVARSDTPLRYVEVRRIERVGPASPGGAPLSWQGEGRKLRVEASSEGVLPSGCRLALRELGPSSRGWADRIHDACRPASAAAWPTALLLLWLSGGLAATALGVRAGRAGRSALGPLGPAGPRSRRALAGVWGDLHRPVRLAVSHTAISPCVVGRTVILPIRCEAELSDGELEAVLGHELAHVARRDPIWLGAFAILVRVLWLQPLNRVAREGFLAAAELVCDDWSVKRTQRPLDLARSISKVAEWSDPGSAMRPAPALSLSGARALSGRVRRLVAIRRGRREVRLKRYAALAAVLLPTRFLPAVPVAAETHAVVIRAEVMEVHDSGEGYVSAPQIVMVRQIGDL